MCWVPSKVSSGRELLGQVDAALYGVAGSWVVDTTRVGASPGAKTVCGLLVGGTGQNAQVPRGASPVNSPTHERRDLAGSAVFVDDLGPIGNRWLVNAIDRHPRVGGVAAWPCGSRRMNMSASASRVSP